MELTIENLIKIVLGVLVVVAVSYAVYYFFSNNVFDFGKKNSTNIVNYLLKINITDNKTMNNFATVPISEKEFMK